MPQIKAGRLRPLAVMGGKRIAGLPDVPAVAEELPGFDAPGWVGVLVPAGTPKPIVDRLNREILEALAAPDVRQRIADMLLEPAGGHARGVRRVHPQPVGTLGQRHPRRRHQGGVAVTFEARRTTEPGMRGCRTRPSEVAYFPGTQQNARLRSISAFRVCTLKESGPHAGGFVEL